VLINLPQQKAAPPCYPIPGSSHHIPGGSVENQPLLFFFLTVAGGEREENWEGGALLPLESLSYFFVLNIYFFVHKWREKQRGNTGKPTGEFMGLFMADCWAL